MDWNVRSTQSTSDPKVMNEICEQTQKERWVGRRALVEFFRFAVCGLQKWRRRDRGPIPDRPCGCSRPIAFCALLTTAKKSWPDLAHTHRAGVLHRSLDPINR
jgi:hypothetical protein